MTRRTRLALRVAEQRYARSTKGIRAANEKRYREMNHLARVFREWSKYASRSQAAPVLSKLQQVYNDHGLSTALAYLNVLAPKAPTTTLHWAQRSRA
jgi:hypothetical protein